jgi:hypothetical protein
VFVVLSGTLTMLLGDPPERVELPPESIVAVAPGTPLQVRNDSDEEAVVFIYGAPPVQGGADFFDDPRARAGYAAAAMCAAFSNTSSPSCVSTSTVSPSPNSPSSSRRASGFSTSRWSARFNGRAP